MKLNKDIFKNYIENNDKLIVGVSGGADSMCLLDLIEKYSKNCKFEFCAVHINHGIRGEEAFRDAEHVKKICDTKKIKVIIKNIDAVKFAKENSQTLEQAARELRYEEFKTVMKEIGANKLFVAHHKDDQAETVLMHILRGASISGARGMKNQSGNIYRPLLSFTRKEIEEYNKNNEIEYINDSTNNEIKYRRNYIRNKIMPQMAEVYPNVVDSLCNFAEKCLINEEYFNEIIGKEKIVKDKDCIFIPIDTLNQHYAIASRLIKKAIEMAEVYSDIEEKHIEAVLSLVGKQNGKEISLPHSLKAYKENQNIVISKCLNLTDDKEVLFGQGVYEFENFGSVEVQKLTKNEKILFGTGLLYFDLDKLPQNVIWRKRKQGDVFHKFSSGSKRLSDFFNEVKLPKRNRDNIPVLAFGNEVFVVPGYEISDKIKITKETTNVMKIKTIQFNHKC